MMVPSDKACKDQTFVASRRPRFSTVILRVDFHRYDVDTDPLDGARTDPVLMGPVTTEVAQSNLRMVPSATPATSAIWLILASANPFWAKSES